MTFSCIQVHFSIVLLSFLLLLVIVALALYQDPLINGFGCLVFILGIPMYFLGKLARKADSVQAVMGTLWLTLNLVCTHRRY